MASAIKGGEREIHGRFQALTKHPSLRHFKKASRSYCSGQRQSARTWKGLLRVSSRELLKVSTARFNLKRAFSKQYTQFWISYTILTWNHTPTKRWQSWIRRGQISTQTKRSSLT
ncbi:hypothetical protein BD410DRAFT_329562 [Rickenella mellea]|uniref:Uncharacterized protein n=1 Tax=Rickenella mellea TaxID=50990 RepID=A0A4Y7QK98_9AGAM|nr:hypothetical protein BD410DRAFT_329562 [Rickenella mellea]